MHIPEATKPALWGGVIGAMAMALLGFTLGGWTTARSAESLASVRADNAVVAALAPVCADRFRHTSEVAVNTAALKKTDAWSQGVFVEKGGWATMPGNTSAERVSAVARACAVLLASA
ncbi:hypothetical protein [Eleftheria terrae]|uniref:hypothetical protein n=1 Tax=Eleftheria terrae TaxID=1597781 RepID=UPI00263B6A30|nr:hypothetical protein [Eleftheria terrae]WKB55847.1 hypothetical protein N7L95_27600 [Eleftheria terrae]